MVVRGNKIKHNTNANTVLVKSLYLRRVKEATELNGGLSAFCYCCRKRPDHKHVLFA